MYRNAKELKFWKKRIKELEELNIGNGTYTHEIEYCEANLQKELDIVDFVNGINR